nr:hypothetical protein [Tanacetum cinerariifolium]
METVRVVTRWEMTRVVKWCLDDGDDVGDGGDGGTKAVVIVVAAGVMFVGGGVRVAMMLIMKMVVRGNDVDGGIGDEGVVGVSG